MGDYIIEWPVINPDDDFEITPYCKRGDDVCAEELIVCYNANDCDGNSYGRQSWTQVGELWDEAGSCLYDDNEDDVWECLDEALDDWLDDNMDSRDDYDDLEDEEEEESGLHPGGLRRRPEQCRQRLAISAPLRDRVRTVPATGDIPNLNSDLPAGGYPRTRLPPD